MSSDKEIIRVIEQVLKNHPNTLANAVANEFVKKEKLSHEEIQNLIGEGFKRSFADKVQELSGYFQTGGEKYFIENLTNSYEGAIQKYLLNDKDLNKKIDKMFKKHFKEMNLEKVILDFFNTKKELCMELMLKNMLNGK